MHKKIVFLLLVTLFFCGCSEISKNITPSTPGPQSLPEVSISTDKNEYHKGETLNISVKNGLDELILYYNNGDRFWNIEYLEDGMWKKFGYEGRQGFQLADGDIGDTCYIAQYELMPPEELEPKKELTSRWNQKICPFETGDVRDAKVVRYIESGKYRFAFYYGFEVMDNLPYRISEPITAYSNPFTILDN